MLGFFGRLLKTPPRKEPSTAAAPSPDTAKPQRQNTLNRDQLYHQLLGNDHSPPLSLPQKLALSAVERQLDNADQYTTLVPRLPSIIPQLIRSLRDPKASARDYVAIIRKDPSMNAGVLRLAGSVYFNPSGRKLIDIEEAVVKLGINGLRSVLSTVVMQPVIQTKTRTFPQFGAQLWQQSLATAIVCELLAKQRQIDTYKCYLMGLVHNIGYVTVFTEICHQMDSLPNADKPPAQQVLALLNRYGDQLSCAIAQQWQLPDELVSAMKQQFNTLDRKNLGPFAKILDDAQQISCRYLLSRGKPISDDDANTLSQLGLPADLHDILRETVN